MIYLICLGLLTFGFYYTNYRMTFVREESYLRDKFLTLALLRQKGKAKEVMKGL